MKLRFFHLRVELAVAAAFLLGTLRTFAVAELPQGPIILSPEEGAKAAKELVADLLSRRPAENTTSTGTLKRGRHSETPVRFEIVSGDTGWSSVYEAPAETNGVTELKVIHVDGRTNEYRVIENGKQKTLSGNSTMMPFAGSDFWVADLGLEFLFWPEQRVLRKELRRGQACDVLESVNPHPAPGAYRRVVSWIDTDSGGIINADAYDFQNRPLKEFIAKSVKKVQGQWELKEIEMDNRQTGSRTWLEFDLDKK